MGKKVLILGMLFFLTYIVKSQEIGEIEYEREGNKILVTYSISKAKFYHVFDIELFVSLDGGESFTGPLTAVEGDVGEGVVAGKRKRIYWDVFREFNQLKGEILFDVRAKVRKNIQSKYFAIYQGNNITPYGLKVGHIGLWGWYLSTFTNTNFGLSDFEIGDGIIENYPSDQYYIVTDNKKYLRYSVVAGINYQFLKNTYANLGVGYGYKELNQAINEFSYINDEYLNKGYVKNTSESYSGLELEVGLMYKWNNILISGGINALNFKRLDWNVGVGYCF